MKIIKYLTGLLFLANLPCVAAAQDTLKYTSLSLAAGLSNMWNKDMFQSPYTYRGNNVLIGASYTRSGLGGQHIADLSYTSGKMASVVSPPSDSRLIRFSYAYLFSAGSKKHDKKLILSIGPELQSCLLSMNYLPGIDQPKTYSSAAAYLGVRGNLSYRFDARNALTLHGGLPLFGVVYRPDFDVNGKSLTEISTIAKGGLFAAGLEYRRQLTPRLSLMAAYRYSYLSVDVPRPLILLQNGLSAGIKVDF